MFHYRKTKKAAAVKLTDVQAKQRRLMLSQKRELAKEENKIITQGMSEKKDK